MFTKNSSSQNFQLLTTQPVELMDGKVQSQPEIFHTQYNIKRRTTDDPAPIVKYKITKSSQNEPPESNVLAWNRRAK